jgi:hypothetical protein
MKWDSTTIETELFLKSSFFWVLHSVDFLLRVVTDVSGQPVGPIFEDQPVQGGCRQHLGNGVGGDCFSEKYQFTLRNIPEEPRSQLHGGWSLTSSINCIYYTGKYATQNTFIVGLFFDIELHEFCNSNTKHIVMFPNQCSLLSEYWNDVFWLIASQYIWFFFVFILHWTNERKCI